jgi:hypothetical protein
MKMNRAWINQPSTHSLLHKYHGTNVLVAEEKDPVSVTVYFLDGDTISMLGSPKGK